MARIRTIKPEFPHSESMGRVSREARLLFIQLWTLADDSGRLRGNSRILASLLYPYDDDAKDLMDSWLLELEKEGCIARYLIDGATYLQIISWLEHQKIDKPSPSKLPQFTEDSRVFAKPREGSLSLIGSGPVSGTDWKGSGAELASGEKVGVKPPDSETDVRARVDRIKSKFPTPARADWITGEKLMRQIVLNAISTWDEIEAGVERYALLCAATNRPPQNPGLFFAAIDRPWLQPWPLPTSKASSSKYGRVRTTEEMEAEEAVANAKH